MNLPTIYLDFDGVLHSNQAQGKQLLSQMPLLEQALKGSDVRSGWRTMLPTTISNCLVAVSIRNHPSFHENA